MKPSDKPKPLHNKIDKKVLKAALAADPTPRTTLSFYSYVRLPNPKILRDQLYQAWDNLGVLGRIYLAKEGINAQLSVPTANTDALKKDLAKHLSRLPTLKTAIEDDGKSFYKLNIKVRKKLVADGLDLNLNLHEDQPNHIPAKTFNEMMAKPDSLVIDARNHYEHEVGHFKGAVRFDADTFRELLPKALKHLQGSKTKTLLLYCTGGIRCETVSALLRREGFEKVFQLDGGIIQYAHSVRNEGLESTFVGKNFVFDERLGEAITNEVVSHCHQCHKPSDRHANCNNDDCHLLFIQCEVCAAKMKGCCSATCMAIVALPEEEQKKRRRGQPKPNALGVYKSRLRPKLFDAEGF